MKSIRILAAVAALFASLAFASAQTNTTASSTNALNQTPNLLQSVLNDVKASGVLSATNYSFNPYATYAPHVANGSQFGGGVFVAYNVTEQVGFGIGADYLGTFSMFNVGMTLKQPVVLSTFLPFEWAKTSFIVPIVTAGAGTPLTGNGSSSAIAIAGAGAYLKFGHWLGGNFNVGAMYDTWSGTKKWDGPRYQISIGYSLATR